MSYVLVELPKATGLTKDPVKPRMKKARVQRDPKKRTSNHKINTGSSLNTNKRARITATAPPSVPKVTTSTATLPFEEGISARRPDNVPVEASNEVRKDSTPRRAIASSLGFHDSQESGTLSGLAVRAERISYN